MSDLMNVLTVLGKYFYILQAWIWHFKRKMVWIKHLKNFSSLLSTKKNNKSVNVRALPASPSLLRKSDVVCSLSAGCHRAKDDRWSVTLRTIFNFSEPMFSRPIWTGLGTRQYKFFVIGYSNRQPELPSQVRKQTFFVFMCHGTMSTVQLTIFKRWCMTV